MDWDLTAGNVAVSREDLLGGHVFGVIMEIGVGQDGLDVFRDLRVVSKS